MQLPTPTPAPEIPLTDIERIISTSAAKAQELNWQQMTFVIVVLAFVLAIAIVVYFIRRPNKPPAETTAVESMAGLVASVQKENERSQQLISEGITASTNASTELSTSVKHLDGNFDRLVTHIEQMATREVARDKRLDSISAKVDTLVVMAEDIQKTANELKELKNSMARLEDKTIELQRAIEAIKQTEKTLSEIKEDTRPLAPVIPLDADGAPELKAS